MSLIYFFFWPDFFLSFFLLPPFIFTEELRRTIEKTDDGHIYLAPWEGLSRFRVCIARAPAASMRCASIRYLWWVVTSS